MKKIFLGIDRPDISQWHPQAAVLCPCGAIIENHPSLLKHWQEGHFDIPVYKYIREENDRIVESLSPPEDEAK